MTKSNIMKIRLVGFMAALLFISCVAEESKVEKCTIRAVIESDDTKTSVNDLGGFLWSSGDEIWLQTTLGGVVGTLSDGAGTADANFSYGTFVGEMTGLAVYPYNANHSVSGGTLKVFLPDSYDLGSNLSNTNALMYGNNVNGTINFRHLAGVMRFVLRNLPVGTDKFQITLDKKINGEFVADLNADEPVLEATAAASESERTVTLTFDALKSVSNINLYVPLPVGTYESLELAVYAGSESVWTYSNTVTNQINRKTLKLMPAVTMNGTVGGTIETDETAIPNNQIWYTASEKITPALGAAVESEEWDASTGKGIIIYKSKLTSIDNNAFRGLSALHEITLPKSLKTIGRYAFYSCANLRSVTFSQALETIEEYAFYGCEALEELTMPKYVESIGRYAFAECSGLGKTTIGDSITDIGEYAFMNCSGRLFINKNVGSSWFIQSGFTEVVIAEGVTSIGSQAFMYSTVAKVSLPNTITNIGESAFANSLLHTINLPESITSIQTNAFAGCCLTSLKIPTNLRTIADGAFQSNEKLISVDCGNVTSIGNYAFSYCDIWQLSIGDTVTTIGYSAFRGNGMEAVTIPASVVSIGDTAFADCPDLRKVTCNATAPPTLGYSVFDCIHYTAPGAGQYEPIGCSIYVPASSVSNYRNARNWNRYNSYITSK